MGKFKVLGIIIIIVIIGAGAYSANIIPGISAAPDNSTIITYGETTYNNQEYKSMVDDYFNSKSTVSLDNAENEIITASDVNEISQGISQKTYNSNQIYSSALVQLENNNEIKIVVDSSKITLVTAEMYGNALESAGITQGYVAVSSPVQASGESALAGIMNCYEKATNTEIPQDVKEAANEEVYMQAEVANNSNISGDKVSDLVSDVKDEVQEENVTDVDNIIVIINNIASENNINISTTDAQNIAESISQTQSVQDQAQDYQQQLSQEIQNTLSG